MKIHFSHRVHQKKELNHRASNYYINGLCCQHLLQPVSVGNRAAIVLLQRWSDVTLGKVLILYKKAEGGIFRLSYLVG